MLSSNPRPSTSFCHYPVSKKTDSPTVDDSEGQRATPP